MEVMTGRGYLIGPIMGGALKTVSQYVINLDIKINKFFYDFIIMIKSFNKKYFIQWLIQ